MKNSVFDAPNCHLLSDEVISDVKQRARIGAGDCVYQMSNTPTSRGATTSQMYALPESTLQHMMPPPQSCTTPAVVSLNNAEAEKDVAIQLYRRKLRRERQIRYRRKKNNLLGSLQQDNQHLRVEIKDLTQRCRALTLSTSVKASVWGVVVEYFHLFHFGLRPETNLAAQEDFLRGAMAPNVMANGRLGVEAVLASWKCLSLSFSDLELRLEALQRGPGETLIALTSTSITITEKTLQNVFPHLLSNESTTYTKVLADKLVGKTIVMRGSMLFEWDSACSQVTRITSQSDLLTPVLGILESVSDVSVVFEKSPLSPEFQWR